MVENYFIHVYIISVLYVIGEFPIVIGTACIINIYIAEINFIWNSRAHAGISIIYTIGEHHNERFHEENKYVYISHFFIIKIPWVVGEDCGKTIIGFAATIYGGEITSPDQH